MACYGANKKNCRAYEFLLSNISANYGGKLDSLFSRM